LYDLTNTHFEGVCADNPKARYGNNKQKRNDCPQVVVGMVFDQYGFEVCHKVFEGNKADSTSLESMVSELSKLVDTSEARPLIVMDSGIATEKNLAFLRERNFRYLVNDSRPSRGKYSDLFMEDTAFSPVSDRSENKPQVLVRSLNEEHSDACKDGEENADSTYKEQVLLCKSAQRGKKELAIISKAEERFLGDLKRLQLRIEKGRLKEVEKVERATGRLLQKHPKVGRFYEVAYDCDKRLLSWNRKDDLRESAEALCGCYVLRTNDETLDKDALWKTYITLTKAEAGFKALKSDLGLRPNYHQKEERVDGHIFICVLAYHLLRHIHFLLEKSGDYRSWDTIKRVLQTHSYSTIVLPTTGGETHRIRKSGQPEESQKSIYHTLNIDWHGLPKQHIIVRK
jgi:transposase